MNRLFAATAPGLEAVGAAEARALGFADVEPVVGGVDLVGDPLRANRMLAVPNRVLLRVARFKARTFKQLIAGAEQVDWTPFGGLTPQVTCRKSRLYHSGAVAERLATVVPTGEGQLFARVHRDVCTLSVDTTGELAHHRAWRVRGGPAPIRATLAAGLLRLADWRPGEALYDPMCGTGTLLIEAALRAAGRWPGVGRPFACTRWTAETELPEAVAVPTTIAGSDRAAGAIDAARANAAHTDIALDLVQRPAHEARAPHATGLLVCNPPYGRRVSGRRAYDVLGALLEGPFAGWRAGIICPRPELADRIRRPIVQRHRLRNGGLPVEWVVFGSASP